jgi:hypothetical protein
MPFRFGGNENGRNNGERLAVDPNDDRVLLLGTRSSGLWRSADFGATWAKVEAFPAYDEAMPMQRTAGGYVPQAVGINILLFDGRSGARGSPTPVIYAAVSTPNPSLFRSVDSRRLLGSRCPASPSACAQTGPLLVPPGSCT